MCVIKIIIGLFQLSTAPGEMVPQQGEGGDNRNSPFWGTGLKYNFKCPDKCAVVLLSLRLLFSIGRGGSVSLGRHAAQANCPFPP